MDFSNINVQDVFKLYTENLKYKRLLYDQNTNLPSVGAALDLIKQKLEGNFVIGVISIKLESVNPLENSFGWETYDKLIEKLNHLIHEALEKDSAKNFEVTLGYTRSDEFNLFVFTEKNGGRVTAEYLEVQSEFLRNYINTNLTAFSQTVNQLLTVKVGFSLIINNNYARAERIIYKGINDAHLMANLQEERTSRKMKERLKSIISKRSIRTLFQPIFDMNDLGILAYEALSAGPAQTEMESPEILFALADKTGLALDLDRLCRQQIIRNAIGFPSGVKLFINIEPSSLDDPQFSREMFINMLKELNLDPNNIVLEITERVAIKNFTVFLQSLEEFKSSGFKIAVDDAGAGYASLNSIAHLKPEYLKFDMALVRNIDKDPIKQQLLEALLDFASRIDSKVIAEGIETEAEFNTLRNMNAQYGQGYFLARPGPPYPKLKEGLVI